MLGTGYVDANEGSESNVAKVHCKLVSLLKFQAIPHQGATALLQFVYVLQPAFRFSYFKPVPTHYSYYCRLK